MISDSIVRLMREEIQRREDKKGETEIKSRLNSVNKFLLIIPLRVVSEFQCDTVLICTQTCTVAKRGDIIDITY